MSFPEHATTHRVAMIAGAGRFPFHVAQESKRQGCAIIALGIQGWVDPTLATQVDSFEELPVGQIGTLIERLKAHQIQQVIMAGKVTKDVLLNPKLPFDAEAQTLLHQVKDVSVNSLLGAIANRLAREGITLLDSSTFLKANLCPAGTLTARAPSPAEEEDIRIGWTAARQLAALDIGQTVVVKRKVVVAVEALEGTDAAIQRAHTLAGDGLIVVKAASPTQDRRFDLPVIGIETIMTLTQSGVACMAVEAGTTLLLDRDALLTAANAAGLCLVGIAPNPV